MSPRPPSPGDHIESHCTRCRALMNHTLIALVDNRPVRVKCNTCGGEHAYRMPKAPAAATQRSAARKTPPRVKADPAVALREEWTAQMAGKDPASARAYGMDVKFTAGGLLRHPSFGLGVVLQDCGDRKIEVMFETGKKVLRGG